MVTPETTGGAGAPEDIASLPSEALPREIYGILITGMARAGKTTLREIIENQWYKHDPNSPVLPFSNSNGFRGMAYRVLEHYGYSIAREPDQDNFQECLEDYLERTGDITPVIQEIYEDPPITAHLRNPAVNAVVATVSEHPRIRPQINQAGADLLLHQVLNPDSCGLPSTPGLVVMELRSHIEGIDKFHRAGICTLGGIVLTCDETIAASRGNESLESIHRRNTQDRERLLGPMTAPEDFQGQFRVDQLLDCPDPEAAFYEAGRIVARYPTLAAIHLPTDRVNEEQERAAIEPIMAGMLAAHA